MIEAILKYQFMRNAVLSAFFVSIICGIVGTIIVEKHMANIAGGIAHTSFGGIGLGYLIKKEPIIVGLVFTVVSTLIITMIKKVSNTKVDTLINMLWAAGMALGILFISITPGYPPDMTSYFFGNILAVSNNYIKILTILSSIIVLIIFTMYYTWQAYLFDEEHLKILGYNVTLLEIVFIIMIAVAVVLLIKIVGITLIIALLTIPSIISRLYTKSLFKRIISSIIVSMILCYLGLYISYTMNIPSGATIILLAIVSYIILICYFSVSKRYKYSKEAEDIV
ncbi:metal ABC transporter permease [Clostridiaceae bacterium M8S5]|nr:metal ABC transporter permease [Clostridiaceae bacterium M8S5]